MKYYMQKNPRDQVIALIASVRGRLDNKREELSQTIEVINDLSGDALNLDDEMEIYLEMERQLQDALDILKIVPEGKWQ